jgi:hypothetical protein
LAAVSAAASARRRRRLLPAHGAPPPSFPGGMADYLRSDWCKSIVVLVGAGFRKTGVGLYDTLRPKLLTVRDGTGEWSVPAESATYARDEVGIHTRHVQKEVKGDACASFRGDATHKTGEACTPRTLTGWNARRFSRGRRCTMW